MYAVIRTGGKQYRVYEGDILNVEKLDVQEGATVEFDEVLALSGDDGLKDSKYYEILANRAHTKMAKDLLMEFSKDEYMHAQNFMNAYYSLTGRMYQPENVEEPNVPDDFEKALKERILAETDSYKEYGEQYLKAPTTYLQALFFMTRTSEAQHAMRMPILLHECRENDKK